MTKADRIDTMDGRVPPLHAIPSLRVVPRDALGPPAPVAPADPDGELRAIAAAFDALAASTVRLIDASAGAVDDRLLSAALRPLHAGQRRLVDRMAGLAAATPAAIGLKARMLVTWAPEWHPDHLDEAEADATDRLLAGILRDLLAARRAV